MKLIIASNNAHKLTEMKAILAPYFDEVVSMREAGIEHETVEDGQTFLENATKKARELAELSGCCAIADDSGLCVDALAGQPGIYSARFAGVHGDDKANNALLLHQLEGEKNRKAHYTCAIALAWPDGKLLTAEDYLQGEIAYDERGENGFGYDPLFLLPDRGLRTAELSPEEKNAISHRGKALRKLVALLEEDSKAEAENE
jgi:XTP/dITP diphosphohydrolase